MSKFLIFSVLILAISNAQLIFPNVTHPPVKDEFSINDLLGNYYVAGLYTDQPLSLLPDQKVPKCMIMSLTIDGTNTVTMKTVFVNPTTNEKETTSTLYLSIPGNANELLSQADTLFNIKRYNGENDLIVRDHGENDGKVILEKRDGSLSYLLSRTGVSSADLAALQGKAKALGVKASLFTVIDNTNC